jgi:hypothetical protein
MAIASSSDEENGFDTIYYCDNCGNEVGVNAQFCPKCGLEFENESYDDGELGLEDTDGIYKKALEIAVEDKMKWPTSFQERNVFITENLGKLWDLITEANVQANMDIINNEYLNGSNFEDSFSCANTVSHVAWNACARLLLIIILLEDSLGVEINPNLKYEELKDFITQKSLIRSKLKC